VKPAVRNGGGLLVSSKSLRARAIRCAFRSRFREVPVSDSTPVLDTLADITTASIEHNSLSPREFMLARMAALVAVDAPPASYLANAAAADEAKVTAEDLQGIMIAVAPLVGTARVVSAAGKIVRALGLAIAVTEAELAAEDGEL
jgi:Carboxymuconolactone decarboxylase family